MPLDVVDVREQLSEHETVLLAEIPAEGVEQFLLARLQSRVCIGQIGLAPRHLFDMPGVDPQCTHPHPFECRGGALPVDSRALHHDRFGREGRYPARHLTSIAFESAELPQLNLQLPVRLFPQHTDRQLGL